MKKLFLLLLISVHGYGYASAGDLACRAESALIYFYGEREQAIKQGKTHLLPEIEQDIVKTKQLLQSLSTGFHVFDGSEPWYERGPVFEDIVEQCYVIREMRDLSQQPDSGDEDSTKP